MEFIKKPKVIVSILSGVVVVVVMTKGDKITVWLGSITAACSALSLPDWGIIVGIFSSLVVMASTVFFKWLNSVRLKRAIDEGRPVGHIYTRQEADI